jgi:hypothetical protein
LASLADHCTACTASGCSDSSAARRANGGAFRKILLTFASNFRLFDA